jgi:hypothetical protein
MSCSTDGLEKRLAKIKRRQHSIQKMLAQAIIQEETKLANLTNLQNVVAAQGEVIDSAVALMGELSNDVKSNAADQAQIDALTADLQAKHDVLAAAVVANTPAAPAAA